MSSSEFSYNAPQFYTNLADVVALSEEDDDFFDANEVKDGNKEKKGETDYENKENVLSDIEEESLNDSFSRIKIKSKFEGIDLALDCDRKSHPMLTRQDISIMSPKLSLELRNRNVLKEVDSRVSLRPSIGKKRNAEGSPNQGSSVAKYRSLAESIYHFQRDTPPRFRGVSKKQSGFRFSTALPPLPTATVPETPHFLSERRLRHCSEHCLSQEERELQEIQEAKQNFKPLQLNKKIFDPLKEVDREKHFTVPKPFNLTEQPPKKVEEKKEELFVFKAKPLPQSIYYSAGSMGSRRLPVVMEENEEDEVCSSKFHGFKEIPNISTTKVMPFSFDERDKLQAIRKNEKIKKIIDEEKRAATFKAQPLPSYISELHNSSIQSASSPSTYHRHESDEIIPEFKARPATVLYKKPFQVKKSGKTATKFIDVKLNTEERAHHRHAFDEQRKANDQEREFIEAKLAEEKEQKIKEYISKMRKESVHKPLPLPGNINSTKTSSEELNQDDSESEEN